MSAKKNQTILDLPLKHAIAIVITGLLAAFGGGIFTGLSTANNDHFTIIAHSDKIQALEQNTVKRDVYQVQYENLIEKLETNTKAVEALTKELKDYHNRN